MSEDNKTPECLIPALRQYRHNRGDGLVAAYDYDLVNKEIATKDARMAVLEQDKRVNECMIRDRDKRLGAKDAELARLREAGKATVEITKDCGFAQMYIGKLLVRTWYEEDKEDAYTLADKINSIFNG